MLPNRIALVLLLAGGLTLAQAPAAPKPAADQATLTIAHDFARYGQMVVYLPRNGFILPASHK